MISRARSSNCRRQWNSTPTSRRRTKISAAPSRNPGACARRGTGAVFRSSGDLDPTYVIARNNLALALVQMGHVPEAIEQFQLVLQIDPQNAKARDSLEKLQAIKR